MKASLKKAAELLEVGVSKTSFPHPNHSISGFWDADADAETIPLSSDQESTSRSDDSDDSKNLGFNTQSNPELSSHFDLKWA